MDFKVGQPFYRIDRPDDLLGEQSPTRPSRLTFDPHSRSVGREWVRHEVAYALSHQISVLALTTPGVDVTEQFEVIADAFRPAHPSIVCWPTLG